MKGLFKTRHVFVMALVVLLGLSSLAKAETPVNFPDANLKAAVELKLGKTDPTPSDMLLLTHLNIINSGITDLTGLEHATNLASIWGWDNQISDLTPLAGLTSITTLRVSNNQISDISALLGMTNLTHLNLNTNQISNISAITGKTSMVILELGANQISDISALSGMTAMTRLILNHNQISDISALSGMTAMTKLVMDNNQIGDISALSGMANLATLWATQNQIISLTPLSGLTNITDMLMSNNLVSDISHLSGNIGMTRLILSNNLVSDISALSNMPNLGQLAIGSLVTDISVLSQLTNLAWLSLHNNQISDLTPLAGLTNLWLLSLSSNNISDISPLAGLTNLTKLVLSDNPLSDISVVSGMTKLLTFWSWSTQLSDLTPLAGLTTLTDLHVSGNQISDLSPLLLITNLTRLVLSGNQVSDLSPLSGMTNLGQLHLVGNQVSDISVISWMTNLGFLDLRSNQVSDISALSGLMNLGVLWLVTNPLNNEAYCIYLPMIQNNNPGINLTYDPGECLDLNQPPEALAGGNVIIDTIEQSTTTLLGTASDPDNDLLDYRWLEGATVLLDSTAVFGGLTQLDLSSLSPLSIGAHNLTLEVNDGLLTATDVMILTIENSPPTVAPSGGGTFQLGVNITLSGQVSDFDGDTLNYSWKEGANVFISSSIPTIGGGDPVTLDDHVIVGGLSLGTHTITLEANDGTNPLKSNNITVDVIDTTAPSISATVDPGILWPPNHKMVDVVVQANADDNSGSVNLTATVASSEPPDTDGDGNTIPDFTDPVIDQGTGVITLQLRSERKGQGTGRTYTITVTATDDSGNSSDAIVEVVAPHDKGKK